MSKFLLTHWEAVELFCRIMKRYDEQKVESSKSHEGAVTRPAKRAKKTEKIFNYRSEQVLKDYLEKASHDSFKKEVSDKISDKYSSKIFFPLSMAVRSREPYMPSDDHLTKIFEYLGDPAFKLSEQNYRRTETWKPDKKKEYFENTVWRLYTFDEDTLTDENHSLKIPVLNQAILKFNSFSKIEVKVLTAGQIENYVGEFHMFGNLSYLILKLRTIVGQKYLRFEFYVGQDQLVPLLAMGQYHNIADTIYSGTAIIVKETKHLNLKPAIFNKAKDEAKIPDYIWQYFETKSLNRLRTPAKINRPQELSAWLIAKRNGEH